MICFIFNFCCVFVQHIFLLIVPTLRVQKMNIPTVFNKKTASNVLKSLHCTGVIL